MSRQRAMQVGTAIEDLGRPLIQELGNVPLRDGTFAPEIWIIHNRDRVNMFIDKWILNHEPIRNLICAPLNIDELNSESTKPTRNEVTLKWESPPHGSFKLNTDGYFDKGTGNGDIGGVIRNSRGD
ncbi:hypothetical protein RND71_026033 [Anisodus tanguticus]|uniref:RNase H type-1 domain-containing protein n=1 Tax=Anisodus tanguticus TaxID=243964 RepID=A0AAE1RMI2_9SOLA|nr:hypothetical protein RND71_026033 [Anisodus tanguticus]